jgi:uncharacterized Zn-binding protein involved in type VI secretion
MSRTFGEQDYQIVLKQGLAANINALATRLLAILGEPHYTTDTKQLYVFDGSNNVRIHGLDMAVVYGGDVVTMGGEIVWLT